MLTILIFIIILGLLVFVHEFGHFIVARRNGIKADEFGFGFPPRFVGVVKNDTTGKYDIIWGNQDIASPHTIYSFNWIPLGGFVKIKGEEGGQTTDTDSFANKPAWTRIKVLGAGVAMNFLLAWVLISLVYILGLPQPISPDQRGKYPDQKVQILEVKPGTPAADMHLRPLDEIISIDGKTVVTTEEVTSAIAAKKGQEFSLVIKRGESVMTLQGVPRTEYPKNEGALGISLSETALMRYPWYEAIIEGGKTTVKVTETIFVYLGKMLASLVGGAEKVALDVTGPVGIVYLTKQMTEMGFSYLLWFAALLSINLGIFNILPIPALDGGRIFFILIEKIKGKPVSHFIENRIHQVGFMLLLFLMLLVTIRDFSQFQILDKLKGLFI